MRYGHGAIGELLIAKGATIDAKEAYGWTPLHHAVDRGHGVIAELLIAKSADIDAKSGAGELRSITLPPAAIAESPNC